MQNITIVMCHLRCTLYYIIYIILLTASILMRAVVNSKLLSTIMMLLVIYNLKIIATRLEICIHQKKFHFNLFKDLVVLFWSTDYFECETNRCIKYNDDSCCNIISPFLRSQCSISLKCKTTKNRLLTDTNCVNWDSNME